MNSYFTLIAHHNCIATHWRCPPDPLQASQNSDSARRPSRVEPSHTSLVGLQRKVGVRRGKTFLPRQRLMSACHKGHSCAMTRPSPSSSFNTHQASSSSTSRPSKERKGAFSALASSKICFQDSKRRSPFRFTMGVPRSS